MVSILEVLWLILTLIGFTKGLQNSLKSLTSASTHDIIRYQARREVLALGNRFFLHDAHEPNDYLSVECTYTELENAELHDAIQFETGNKTGGNEDSAIVSIKDARKFTSAILGLCDQIEKVSVNG